MIYILFIIVFASTVVYYLVKRNYVDPIFYLLGGFSVVLAVSSYNALIWGIDITLKTTLIILTGIIIFFIGTFLGAKIRVENSLVKTAFIKNVIIPSWIKILFITVMCITVYFQWKYLVELSSLFGVSDGFVNIIHNARRAMDNEIIMSNYPQSFYLKHLLAISKVLGYVFLAYVLNNKVLFNIKTKALDLFPIFLYFIIAILTTGRTQIIYLFIAAIWFYSYFYTISKRKTRKNDLHLLNRNSIFIVFAALILVAIFIIIGNIRTFGNSSPLNIYLGTSVFALDQFVKTLPIISNFGQETLYSLYSFLNRFGLNIHVSSVNLPYVIIEGYTTNIYTAFRRYINDYSFYGLLLIPFITGYFYARIWEIVKHKVGFSFILIALGMFLYPLVEYAIEERFLVTVFTFSTIYTLIYLYIVTKIILQYQTKPIWRRKIL